MRFKLTFIAGFAAGYVLGAKAGRRRYDTISYGMRRLVDSPAVQEAAGVLQAQASGAVASARSTVTARVQETVSSRLGGAAHLFGHHDGSSAHADSAPPYPAAGHEEFGGEG
jgi:hypothetical protein